MLGELDAVVVVVVGSRALLNAGDAVRCEGDLESPAREESSRLSRNTKETLCEDKWLPGYDCKLTSCLLSSFFSGTVDAIFCKQ